jgi:hypothetical protein
MDILLEIIFAIFKAFFSEVGHTSTEQPENGKTLNAPQNSSQPLPGTKLDRSAYFPPGTYPMKTDSPLPPGGSTPHQAESAYEQKAAEVWEAYRRKQDALERELRSKEPKR